MEAKVIINPVSVNQCWQGRRFKTTKYKAFETEMLLKMPKAKLPPAPYRIELIFGFATASSDIDNSIKPTLDLIQKKYGINDRDVYELYVLKKVVGNGNQFINYKIESI